MDLEVVMPGGRQWFAQASGAPVRDAQGNVIGGIAITEDITDRKQAEEVLRQQTLAAQHLSGKNSTPWPKPCPRLSGPHVPMAGTSILISNG